MKTLLLFVLFASFNAQASSLAKALNLHQALYSDSCDLLEDLPVQPEIYSLSEKTDLVFVPCMLGAYQGSHMGYIVKSHGPAQVISVLSYDPTPGIRGVVSSTDLVGFHFEKKTGLLYTHSKGRGLGDCGQSSISKIQEVEHGYVSVKTIEIRDKSECDEDFDAEWTIVFRQD